MRNKTMSIRAPLALAVEDHQGEALPTLWSYAPITRRKFFHIVYDAEGNRRFDTQRMSDAIWWLEREGWSEYRLVTDRGTYRCTVLRERQQKEERK